MNETQLREILPIGDHERIIATVRHHWFAYVGVYLAAGALVGIIFLFLALAVSLQDTLDLSNQTVEILSIAGLIFALLIFLFSLIPVYLRKQESLVITEEAVMLAEKPSLLSSKTSQLNLQHVADVTVHQDAIGTLLGYGKLVIETPGEQDNYEFVLVPNPREAAKQIVEAHENYVAALESGQIRTTLGERPPMPGVAWRPQPEQPPDTQPAEKIPPQSGPTV